MDLDDVWTTIDGERARIADLLDDLTDEEWATPSLCRGWRVRDVAAHLTLAHMRVGRAVVETVRARGSFDGMIRSSAVRQAELPAQQIAGRLRDMVGSRRRVLGLSPVEPLIDVLVHGQDITRPLGRPFPVPGAAAVTAAERVWAMGFPFRARRRFAGLSVTASDADLALGDGPGVTGPVGAVLLALTGRPVALPELTGPGAPTLAGRLGP